MTEMLTRYFRFPTGFENTVYLSQAQQAVAIKSAVEYWRSLRPICMGAVYWQLNDNWPVASWSSLEHSGQWKQLHYHAKRFFAPLLVTLSPTDDKSHWQLIAVNDNQTPTSISGSLTRLHIDGCKLEALKINETVKAGQAQALLQLTHDQVHKEATTSFWVFESDDGALINTFYFAPWKKMNLPKTHVSIDVRKQDHQIIIELNTDAPAHFVTLETKDDTLVNGHFSDNSITLLPDSPKLIHFHGEIASIDAFKHTLTVNHLWKSYQ
jgi:beta-mannosidase